MKKLLSAILSLSLLLSLSAPALAEGQADEAYEVAAEIQAWLDERPEELDAFLADIDAYAQEEWDYDSVAHMAEAWGVSEEYIRAMLTEEWAAVRAEREAWDAWVAEYDSANPGALAALEANAYDYFDQYTWYDSVQEYMELWELTEEEFVAEMVEEQLYAIHAAWELREELTQLKTDLGGVPGQMSVMLNGEYISFPDAIPENVNGRIMVPYRALMEALGGTVGYDDAARTVTCALGDTTLTLVIGESAMTIDEAGTASTLVMDCAAYIKEERTYVPVRFISQAFGYDVLWDDAFDTAVLVDKETMAGEVDSQFTVLNRMLAGLTGDLWQPKKTTGELSGTLTLFDSINGDASYDFSADTWTHAQAADAQGGLTMDLSGLTELLDLEYLLAGDPYYEFTEEEQALADKLTESLAGLSLEYIIDSASGAFYVRSPLLSLLMEYPEDAWLAVYTGEPFTAGDALTAGSLCYELAMAEIDTAYDPAAAYDYWYDTPVFAVQNILAQAELLAELLGDGCFTSTEEGDAYTLDAAALGLTKEDGLTLDLTFTVDDGGAVAGSAYMAVSGDAAGIPGGDEAMTLDCAFSLDAEGGELTMELHVKNTLRLELTAASTSDTPAVPPLTAPPEGDTVIDVTGELGL